MGFLDKREHRRVRVSVPAEVYDILNDKNIAVRIIDISAGGVSMVTNEELGCGTPISISFQIEGATFNKVSADVVREVKKEEHYYLGIAFFNLDPQKTEELDLIVRKIHSRLERGIQRGRL